MKDTRKYVINIPERFPNPYIEYFCYDIVKNGMAVDKYEALLLERNLIEI